MDKIFNEMNKKIVETLTRFHIFLTAMGTKPFGNESSAILALFSLSFIRLALLNGCLRRR
ncbi:MAG: hypothetical protein LBS46_09865 [Dysgonamonadaceae bacterium]|jgi:hypothetical protein|nr:hypothetical protein [Dysgonamonadaceae bacterium]